jgi:hypothetical protein
MHQYAKVIFVEEHSECDSCPLCCYERPQKEEKKKTPKKKKK